MARGQAASMQLGLRTARQGDEGPIPFPAPAGDVGTCPPIDQSFEVSFHYRVHFTEGVFALDNRLLLETLTSGDGEGPTKFLCVIEDGMARHWPELTDSIAAYVRHHGELLALVAPPIVLPGGEAVKNAPELVRAVQAAVHGGGICRQSYVVAVGGGALLDMVGYAAATAHRGVRLVRIPTTVLAQADSGVGVKNSINAFGKKNFLGTFAPPAAVINDSTFLETLTDREWRSGLAEAIKVALLKDRSAFEEIERLAVALDRRDMAAMKRVVYRSARLHLDHIARSGDPFEFGSSRPLDMGHWAAHKLESLSGYQLLHGEAVAIGLALDSTYARDIGLLSDSTWQRVMRLLMALRLPTYAPELDEHLDEPEHARCVLRGLVEFREHLGGELTVMLPRAVGQGLEVHSIDADIVRRCIGTLRSYGRDA